MNLKFGAKIPKCDHMHEMRTTEQNFPAVLFIMLFNVVLAFEPVYEILSVTIQMKATVEQCFPVVLFIMLYKVVQIF